MSHRSVLTSVAVVAVVGLEILVTPVSAGQGAPSSGSVDRRPAEVRPAKPYVAPKTVYGTADMQGVWGFFQITPFERPKELAGKEFFTEAEAIAFEKRAAERTPCGTVQGRDCNPNIDEKPLEEAGRLNELAYDNSFFDTPAVSLVRSRRTSQVIDPPDGRLPALTPEARKRYANAPQFDPVGSPARPEDLQLTNRCIGFHHAPPIRVSPYDNYIEIIQSRDAFVVNAQLHTHQRVIPTDGRPHLPASIRQWFGDSRGRWEGNTFVVETTNFSNEFYYNVYGADENLRLVERFTRVEPDLLQYEYTVEDPTAFTKPWTVSYYMKKLDDVKIYPYTCLPANRAVTLILGAARAGEKAAAEAAQKSAPK